MLCSTNSPSSHLLSQNDKISLTSWTDARAQVYCKGCNGVHTVREEVFLTLLTMLH